MASHKERLAAASDAIEFICSRDPDEMSTVVPNCPGWTVYNVAAHIGRVGLAWHSMIDASPDDPDSRARGYADAESRGSGHSPKVLASWVRGAVEALDGDVDHPAYFSMTGGAGTVGLWGWHAASELGIHRLDVEQALGTPLRDHRSSGARCARLTPVDSSCRRWPQSPILIQASSGPWPPEMARNSVPWHFGRPKARRNPRRPSPACPSTYCSRFGGRPHGPIDIAGSHETLDRWCALPSTAFQFGTWD